MLTTLESPLATQAGYLILLGSVENDSFNHLGNNRVTFDQTKGKVDEENNILLV